MFGLAAIFQVAFSLLHLVSATARWQKRSADDYYVPNEWPTVPFKVPESWAGLMDISSAHGNHSNSLFFWYYQAEGDCSSEDDLVVWLNGGPGCSSIEGILQENGPVLFPFNISGHPDQPYVKLNPYSWNQLASVVWVEQPVGTGFSTGTVDAKSYRDVAYEFFSFLENFYATFPENKDKKLWITGESAAGMMIPYIADYIYSHEQDSNSAGIKLKGISINDPSWTSDFFSAEAAAVPFAYAWQKELKLTDEFLQSFTDQAKPYGLDSYLERNLIYPPPKSGLTLPENYDVLKFQPYGVLSQEAGNKNQYFNVYNVNQSVPISDPLGYPPNGAETTNNVVNNITGFKEMIHAPDSSWEECLGPVFNGTPHDATPDVSVLPGVIEKSERVIIQHGNNDILLMANGSALAIQNMTWGGNRGFQHKPTGILKVNGRDAGKYHSERGLTFIHIWDSGHMIPQDQPAVAFKNAEYLLGRVSYDGLGVNSAGCKAGSGTSSSSIVVSSKATASISKSTGSILSEDSGNSTIASSSRLSYHSTVLPSYTVKSNTSYIPATSSSLSPVSIRPTSYPVSAAYSSVSSSIFSHNTPSSVLSLDSISGISQVSMHTYKSSESILSYSETEPLSGSNEHTLSVASSTRNANATIWTTYCPSPTTFTAAGSTVTVTSPTSLTFTECPCTLSSPYYSSNTTVITFALQSSLESIPVTASTDGVSLSAVDTGHSTVVSSATLTSSSLYIADTWNSISSYSASSPSSNTRSLISGPAVANNGVSLRNDWPFIFSLAVLMIQLI